MKTRFLRTAVAVVCTASILLCQGCGAEETGVNNQPADGQAVAETQDEGAEVQTKEGGAVTAYPEGFVAKTNGKTLEMKDLAAINEAVSSNLGLSMENSVIDSFDYFQYALNNQDYLSYGMYYAENVTYSEAKMYSFDYLFDMAGQIEKYQGGSFEDWCDDYVAFEEYDNGFTLYWDADIKIDSSYSHYYGAYVYADGSCLAILADGTLAAPEEERQEVLGKVDELFDLVGYTRPSEVIAASTCCNVVNNDSNNPYLSMVMPEITPEAFNEAIKEKLGIEMTFTENYRDNSYNSDDINIGYNYFNLPDFHYGNSVFHEQGIEYIVHSRSMYSNIYANAYENGVVFLSSNDDVCLFYYDCYDYNIYISAHGDAIESAKEACAMLGLPVIEDLSQNSQFNCVQ